MTIIVEPFPATPLGAAALAGAGAAERRERWSERSLDMSRAQAARCPSLAVIALLIAVWWMAVVQADSVIFPDAAGRS